MRERGERDCVLIGCEYGFWEDQKDESEIPGNKQLRVFVCVCLQLIEHYFQMSQKIMKIWPALCVYMCVCVFMHPHTHSSVLSVLLDHSDWMCSQDKCNRKWHPSSHFFCCRTPPLTIPYSFLTPACLLQFLCPSSSSGLWSLRLFITKWNGTWFDVIWSIQSSFIWVCSAHGRLRWSEEQRWEIKRPPAACGAAPECRMLRCINGEAVSDHGSD